MRGYFGIGIYHPKTEENIGTLWRSAHIFDASFIFTIGRRYKQQASDTTKAFRHIPLFHYANAKDFNDHRPHDCPLIGIELLEESLPIATYQHPERAIYILGAEDHGLTPEITQYCQQFIILPGKFCMNVAVAGSIVMFDRYTKDGK